MKGDDTMNEEFTLKVEIVELKNEEDFSRILCQSDNSGVCVKYR